jgi:DNA-binding MarR family transcriptional regulator
MNDNELKLTSLEIRILTGAITRIAHRSIEEYLNSRDIEISGLQLGIMHTLLMKSQTISELSRKFMLDPSTLVPVIDALEGKGMVIRERDPNDRRRIPLSVTERGRALVAEVSVVHEDDIVLQAVQALGVEKAAHLLNLLREFIGYMPEGQDFLREMQSRIHVRPGETARLCLSDETPASTEGDS